MFNNAPFPQAAKAYFTRGLGPGTLQARDEVAETTFSVAPTNTTPQAVTIFQNLYLRAGQSYAITLIGPTDDEYVFAWAGGGANMAPSYGSNIAAYETQHSDLAPYPPAGYPGGWPYPLAISVSGEILPQATPAISDGGVVNAAANAPLGANSGIAQGSLFTVYGANLGPAVAISAVTLPLGTSLGEVSVTIQPSNGPPVSAYLVYASNAQINAIAPSNTPLGPAQLSVNYNSVSSSAVTVNMVAANPGIFTTAYGSGPAIAQNYRSPSDVALNSVTSPASAGETMILYGTGLGPIAGADDAAPGAVSPSNISVEVIVGSLRITPLYAGRAPQFPGEDQIDFSLPAGGLPSDGCFVPIAVEVNGVIGNFATISTAAEGQNCPAPFNISSSYMSQLAAGGAIPGGVLSAFVDSTAVPPGVFWGTPANGIAETASAIFASFGMTDLLSLASVPGAIAPMFPPGSCTVTAMSSPGLPSALFPGVAASSLLWAGNTITVGSPGGFQDTLTRFMTPWYEDSLPSFSGPNGPIQFIQPGAFPMTASGGPDVGPFTAQTTIPSPLQCANCSAISTIDRSKPLSVTWTGGGSQDYVQVIGYAPQESMADPGRTVATSFACIARATDQSLTVPADILAQLPPASTDVSAENIGALLVVSGAGAANSSFTAPLTSGGSLAFGYFGWARLLTQTVGYR